MSNNIEGAELLDEIVEGQQIFQSDGYSVVKVTKGGIEKPVRIPIRSSGISELMDQLQKNAPTPPTRKCLIDPANPDDKQIARDMGIRKKQWVFLLDYADEVYLKERVKYESDIGIKIVLRGINVSLKDKSGNLVENDDKRVEILQSIGLSGEQFTQIVRDIGMLTRWKEAEEDDFLPI